MKTKNVAFYVVWLKKKGINESQKKNHITNYAMFNYSHVFDDSTLQKQITDSNI